MTIDIVTKVRNDGRTVLTEIESKELLNQARINVGDARLATSEQQAISVSQQLGFPVVLKVTSPDILHKKGIYKVQSDAGGVKLGLSTSKQVRKAYNEIAER